MLPASDEAVPSERTARAFASTERKLERLAAEDLVSAPGLEFFTTAIDPFGDERRRLAGFPDGAGESTIAQTIRRGLTVTAPAGTPAGGTWDMLIYSTDQVDGTDEFGRTLRVQDHVINLSPLTDPGATGAYGSWVIITAPSPVAIPPATKPDPAYLWPRPDPTSGSPAFAAGTETFQLSPVTVDYIQNGVQIAFRPDTPYLNGLHRVYGQALEIVNASPPLERGGDMIPFRQNRKQSTQNFIRSDSLGVPAIGAPFLAKRSTAPPAT